VAEPKLVILIPVVEPTIRYFLFIQVISAYVSYMYINPEQSIEADLKCHARSRSWTT
jgi:hypothetical protein